MMVSRSKMCAKKGTFYSRQRAEASAAKWGQRVYECPICFCWHCTSKENWREEYVDAEKARIQMIQLESTLRNEFNKILKAKNLRISELERALSRATDEA